MVGTVNEYGFDLAPQAARGPATQQPSRDRARLDAEWLPGRGVPATGDLRAKYATLPAHSVSSTPNKERRPMRKPVHAFAALAAVALALQPIATRAEGTTASADIATECEPCVELPRGEVTDVELRELVPDNSPGRVFIRWRTETQEDNYGFNIRRATQPGGESRKINKSIIPGEGSTNIPKVRSLMTSTETLASNGQIKKGTSLPSPSFCKNLCPERTVRR